MKILIIGGIGFIGSNLAKRLSSENHNIVIMDSLIKEYGANLNNISSFENNLKVNFSDLRDPYALKPLLKGVDLIYNLASQVGHTHSMKKPIEDLDINLKGQLNLLEGVKEICPEALIIYSSTRQVYGKPEYLPVNEKHPINPPDINGIHKFAAEQYHLLFNKVYGIRTVILRLTNTYGPRMRIKDAKQTFLGIWIRNLLEKKPLQVFGDGNQIRDFNYVEDVVEALVLASREEKCEGKIINIGSNEVIKLSNLAQMICSFKKNSEWVITPFPEDRKIIDIGNYCADFSLAQDIMKWYPKIDLENGLKKTIDYYEKNINQYI